MLVLTRKYQEKIRIGDNITITVLRTKGKAVRLGIEAPAEIPVIRGELAFQPAVEEETEPESVEFDIDMFAEEEEAPRRFATAGGVATATRWETARETGSNVELSRVPRSKVSTILPRLVSGAAPLRSMMAGRAGR